MTVGLPRCGKSTWSLTQKLPIVCPDAIRLAIHGQPFLPSAEKLVWAVAHYMVESLFLAGHDKVILDATNLTDYRRNEWRSKKWNREYYIFHEDEGSCIERAKTTNQEYLIPVIKRMAKEAQWPTNLRPDEKWTEHDDGH